MADWFEFSISRRSCVRSHIDTAIRLFFENQDQISAHTLAWAAVDILHDVGSHSDIKTSFREAEKFIKPAFRKQWKGLLRKHYNFAKHADKDPDVRIDKFRPEATSCVLHLACRDYLKIYETQTLFMRVFSLWFCIRNIDMVDDEATLPHLDSYKSLFGNPSEYPFEQSLGAAKQLVSVIYDGREYIPELLAAAGHDGTLER